MTVLHQVIAIEKGIKTRANTVWGAIHKSNSQTALFEGVTKTFQPLNENGEQLAPESVRVQQVVSEQIRTVKGILTELFDVTARKDWANTEAKADVKLDNGRVLIEKAPVSHLLFLEKQLNDLRTYVGNLPTLDPAINWGKDPNSDLHRSEPLKTHRTKKVQKPLLLAPATDKHPAQTQLITEDEIVGHWHTIRLSGALPLPEKRAILERIEEVVKAVKFAREEANGAEAPEKKSGAAICSFIFDNK